MAATAMQITGMITPVDSRTSVRRSVAGITPEFYFQKTIDNSRLVKVSDPQRRRDQKRHHAKHDAADREDEHEIVALRPVVDQATGP